MTSGASGTIAVSLPAVYAGHYQTNYSVVGSGIAIYTAGTVVDHCAVEVTASTFVFRGNAGKYNATIPFTWAAGAILS